MASIDLEATRARTDRTLGSATIDELRRISHWMGGVRRRTISAR
jgi:hypothetical protein